MEVKREMGAENGKVDVLLLAERHLGRILRECAAGYPEEVCGVLIGRVQDGIRLVERVIVLRNERMEERTHRYLIGPDEFRRAETEAAAASRDIVGFYHSHPDHPALPSAFDTEHAWPWYAYMIVPVQNGTAGRPRAWQLLDDRSRFRQLRIAREQDIALESATQPEGTA